MKIGIGAPCLEADKPFIKSFNESIAEMTRKPDMTFIYVNDGTEGLGSCRTKVFDKLFAEGCDVVLNASIDHYLFPDILSGIEDNQITGYGFLTLKPSTFITVLKRAFNPYAWTGVYAVPRKIWMAFKKSPWSHNWDGEGDSIQWFALEHNLKIVRVKKPKYWILRYSLTMKEHAASLSGKKAVFKLMDAWD